MRDIHYYSYSIWIDAQAHSEFVSEHDFNLTNEYSMPDLIVHMSLC